MPCTSCVISSVTDTANIAPGAGLRGTGPFLAGGRGPSAALRLGASLLLPETPSSMLSRSWRCAFGLVRPLDTCWKSSPLPGLGSPANRECPPCLLWAADPESTAAELSWSVPCLPRPDFAPASCAGLTDALVSTDMPRTEDPSSESTGLLCMLGTMPRRLRPPPRAASLAILACLVCGSCFQTTGSVLDSLDKHHGPGTWIWLTWSNFTLAMMDSHTPRPFTFAEAVRVAHTPDVPADCGDNPDPGSGHTLSSSDRRAQVNRLNCHECHFRSRHLGDMASHRHTSMGGLQGSEQCRGAVWFRHSYAHTVHSGVVVDGVPANPDFSEDMGEDMPLQPESPPPQHAGQVPGDQDAVAPPPVPQHPCSATLEHILARLYLSTDAQDVGDLLGPCPAKSCSSPDPDDSEPEDMAADTDQSAASSKMGDEHVMTVIEHIISACTPVAEANALLSILQQAGTVPWRTLQPYLNLLREWHQECGRQAVQTVDLGIPVKVPFTHTPPAITLCFHTMCVIHYTMCVMLSTMYVMQCMTTIVCL